MIAIRQGIRRHPLLSHSQIIFCPEKNTGYVAGYLCDAFEEKTDKHRFYPIAQKGGLDVGYWTTDENKMIFAQVTRDLIIRGNVRIMKDLICVNPFDVRENKREIVIKEMFDQMKRYRMGRDPSKT